jgi:hypothetical protein
MGSVKKHGKSNSENEFITEFDAIFKSQCPWGIYHFKLK